MTVLKRAGSVAPSGTEAEDTGDELLESAFRSAATASTARPRTDRKRSQYRHRKSCMYSISNLLDIYNHYHIYTKL